MTTKLIGLISICIFFQICVSKDKLQVVPWKLVILSFMALFGLFVFSKNIYLVFLCMLFGAYTDSISERVYSLVSYIIGGYEVVIYCLHFQETKVFLVSLLITILVIVIYSYVFGLLGQGDADILIACAIMFANIGVSPIDFVLFMNILASAVFLVIQSIRSVRMRKFLRQGAFVPSLLVAFCVIFGISHF